MKAIVFEGKKQLNAAMDSLKKLEESGKPYTTSFQHPTSGRYAIIADRVVEDFFGRAAEDIGDDWFPLPDGFLEEDIFRKEATEVEANTL